MIVVGVDDSPPGRAAINWSLRRAALTGDVVMLAHVVDDEWGVVGHRSLEELMVDAEKMLAGAKDSARAEGASVQVDSTLLSGNPMLELARASADADLVVVGTHKTGFLRGRVFGSRSLQLAAASTAPVAIVPESAGNSRSGIVVGVDGSPAALAAVTFGAREAHRTQEGLSLVGAWAARDGGRDDELTQRDVLVKSAVEKALMEARVHAQRLCRPSSIRVRQVNRAAAEALVDASATATMLVIGSSRRVDAPLTLGSVAHDVLLNLAGPTVVVHAERPQMTPEEPERVGLVNAGLGTKGATAAPGTE